MYVTNIDTAQAGRFGGKMVVSMRPLKPADAIHDHLAPIYETVRILSRELPSETTLIGFAGAPWTVATYMIAGRGTPDQGPAHALKSEDRATFDSLIELLTQSTIEYLSMQVQAGAEVVKLFDSWAGCLSPSDYREFVLPHTKAVIDGVSDNAPVINFLTGNPALLPIMAEAGGQIVGLDWRVDMADARQMLGPDRAVQGNMDPVSLLADLDTLKGRAKAVLDAAGTTGHIFNLGHGVFPEVPPENAKALVEIVHELGAAQRA